MGMYRTFDGKKYRAYQEYTVKTDAKKDQAKAKAEGYLGRITYSKWATLYILWLRKKQTTTIKKVKSYHPMGRYKETSVDKQKKSADFRLLQVSPNVIRWKGGKTETVTTRTLKKLQEAYTWATDF